MLPEFKEEYKQQLKDGCKKAICHGIFCGGEIQDEIVDEVSETLARYGGVFLCENVHKIVERDGTHSGSSECKPLELFFYCTRRIFSPGMVVSSGGMQGSQLEDMEPVESYINNASKTAVPKAKSALSHDPGKKRFRGSSSSLSESANVEGQFENLNLKDDAQEGRPMECFDHSFCNFVCKGALTPAEKYILLGIIQLLLKKYEARPHFTVGMIIARLYNLIGPTSDLEPFYYSILYKIFCNVHSLYSEVHGRFELCENVVCEGIESRCQRFQAGCLYPSKFTRGDLCNLTDSIASTLNLSPVTDSRENKKIDILLNIFQLLYLINEGCGILGYKKFYLPAFCSRLSFREEFRYYRTKSRTPLTFPFILPVHIKAELIKYENNDRMKASLQDSFFRSLFEGHVDPYLFITVDRQTLYKESIELFKSLNPEDAKKQLRMTFKNEEGVDSGGIRKEYFQLLSQEIKHDGALFEQTDNRVWIKADEDNEDVFEAVGKIIGIALYNNVVINVPFPSLFFKKLLGKTPSVEDLKEIEPEMANSLRSLRRLSRDELGSLGLTFEITYEACGRARKHMLIRDGDRVHVTVENLKLFIEKYSEFYTVVVTRRQFDALARGFYAIIDKGTLSYLDPKELEKIMMGSNAFDLKALRSSTTYSGFQEDAPIINYFWEIFERYDRRKRKRLLQFITGNDRIPVSGSASLRLVIMKNGCDTDRLPSSQTCFNTLLLPEYSSKDKLEKKLETALEMTAGFFLL
jgi:ubiquitin-protein ligase E3 A